MDKKSKKQRDENNKSDIYKKVLYDIDSSIKTDPDGSWTGVPEDPYNKPVQDVDDL